MTGSGKRKSRVVQIILLLLFFLSLPFFHYYLWNYYKGSWDDFKAWYPHTYFIAFPVVKILPFAIIGLIIWIAREPLTAFFILVKSWIRRNQQGILLSLLVTGITLIIAEFGLRKAGYKPGYRIYSVYFRPVDSLIVLDGFAADSSGILTVSQQAREFICDELKRKDCTYDLNPIGDNQAVNVYSIPMHFVTFYSYNYKSPFKSFIRNLDETPADATDIDFIDAVRHYVNCPINPDGFKSIEFKKYNSSRKSILLIGDSFTWGHSATNLTNCFADLLLTKGYVVYNAGIEATDPAQYLAVAEKFIPRLKPDFVIVNFYVGNDVMHFERKPKPYIPAFYSTNAGNLLACPEGVYFNTAEEAYRYTLAHFTIPKEDNGFNEVCSKTVLTTLIWNAITAWKPEWTMSRYRDYYRRIKEVKTKTPFSNLQIEAIKRISQQQGSRFLLVAIPLYDGNKFTYPQEIPELFENLEYYVPPVKKEEYESRKDGHYNDRGHAMHTEFLDSLVRNYHD